MRLAVTLRGLRTYSLPYLLLTLVALTGVARAAAPTISDISDQTISSDSSTGALNFTIGDVDPSPTVVVNAPAGIAQTMTAGKATFGPQSFNVTGELVMAVPANAATPLTNAAACAGKIVVVDRGTVTFTVKVKNAQDAGAIGVIAVNNVAGGGAPNMGGTDATITIPSESVSLEDGAVLKNNIASGVNATLGFTGDPLLALSVSRSSSNTTLVPTGNIVLGGSGANRTVTVTPAAGLTGSALITITVSDGSNTASDTFTLVVDTAQVTSNFVVNSSADTDDGVCGTTNCTLREAINAANDYNTANGNVGATITFNSTVFAAPQKTIALTSALPAITSDTTITGPTAGVTISGANTYQVFRVTSGAVALDKLTIANGKGTDGATPGNAGTAGGLQVSGATVNVTGCTFTGNTGGVGATANGDGITGGGGGGGALQVNSGSVTLTNSTFTGNTGGPGGTGGPGSPGTCIDPFGCFGGSANGDGGAGGGALLVINGTLTLANCTVANNAGGNGGAIGSGGSGGNAGAKGAGGLVQSGGTANLGNSIIAKNSAGSSGSGTLRPDVQGTINSNGYNLIGDGTGATITGTATGNQVGTPGSPINPKLGALADNGGPAMTRAPVAGSPAIDKGKDLSGTNKDQRGQNRQADLDDATYPDEPTGDTSDIGAFEAQSPGDLAPIPSFVVTTNADNGDGTCDIAGTNDGCTLRDAITAANNSSIGGNITFDPTIFNSAKTITLTKGELLITNTVTITGPAAGVTVDASHASRILRVSNGTNSGPTVMLSGLTLINGTASQGGALYNDRGKVTLTVCTLHDNTASGGGAIYTDAPGTLTVQNSTLHDNTANGFGGGIFTYGVLTVQNSTMTRNSAPSGGAIGSYGNVTVQNSTLAYNSATQPTNGNGAGIYSGSSLTLQNSIVAHNTAPRQPDVFALGKIPGDYNLIEDANGWSFADGEGTHNITGQDPKFELDANSKPKLFDNGGPTKTIKLLPGSPAIDQGKNLVVDSNNNPILTDQRGQTRPVDSPLANATGGDGSDIGAFEAQFADLPLTVSFTTANTTPTGTTPAKSSTITSTTLPVITGQASELAKNVVRVDLFLWRNKVQGGVEYWSGSQWTSKVAGMTTTLSPAGGGAGVSWSRNAGLSGSNFEDGTYYLRARVVDQSNSFTLVNSSFTKITESTPPTVSFTTATTTPVGTTPDNGDTVTASTLPVITGKAADSGSGIKRVDLYVVRDKSGGGYEYWNGSGWVNTVTALSTTLSPSSGGASVSWSCNAGLSGSSDFTNGTYYVKAWAYDKSSNGSWVKNTFTRSSGSNSVAQVPAAQASVEGSAVSSSSSISLAFQGTVPTSFNVSVNGAGVGVQSMDREAQSVTLLLSEGSLTAGDQVVVSWKGGQTTLTAQ